MAYRKDIPNVKKDIKIRPVYRRLGHRIEAYICICICYIQRTLSGTLQKGIDNSIKEGGRTDPEHAPNIMSRLICQVTTPDKCTSQVLSTG